MDLTARGRRALIATNILGLANREVALARRHMDGAAYLIIGAAPGKLAGVTPVDPAELVDAIAPYVGGRRPTVGPSLRVEPLSDRPGWGEDDPIHHYRLERNGWRLVDERSVETLHGIDAPYVWTFDPPIRYRLNVGGGVSLEMAIEAYGDRGGSSHVTMYRLLVGDVVIRELGRCDWVDAAPGDKGLLLARVGRLLRMQADTVDAWRDAVPRDVADLRAHRFEARTAPAAAVAWP